MIAKSDMGDIQLPRGNRQDIDYPEPCQWKEEAIATKQLRDLVSNRLGSSYLSQVFFRELKNLMRYHILYSLINIWPIMAQVQTCGR